MDQKLPSIHLPLEKKKSLHPWYFCGELEGKGTGRWILTQLGLYGGANSSWFDTVGTFMSTTDNAWIEKALVV